MKDNSSIFGSDPEQIDELLAWPLDAGKDDDNVTSLEQFTEASGGHIGRYKLMRILGEGGMGIVYLAEQQHPIRRKVALKIIKPGMDSARAIVRFKAEQQALALMDHPNIAHVYDAGMAPSGRPYFVMENINGTQIIEFCDKHKLSIEQRLHLFLQICEAVQHAHQKGIIHRDIKPSNILVSLQNSQAVPKIIDFGVAKALAQSITEQTLYTEHGQLVGTPEYMSPEQVDLNNKDVDTRIDVYSLGVLLYELLTGTLPFDRQSFREGGLEHMRKVICEHDPMIPSTRLSRTSTEKATDLAQKRQSEVRTLKKKFRGDLDWIILKAMEKDRTRRYASVDAMATDIQRHLKNEPILAGSPSTIYLLQKFWRRHRRRIAVTIISVMLLSVTIMSIVIYLRNLKVQWAKTKVLPEIAKLIDQDRYLAAFSLARQTEKYIPEDPLLFELWPRMSREYSVTTTPPGADVFFKEYLNIEGKWQYLGRSPLENISFPRGVYRWKFEKEGFETWECIAGEHLNFNRIFS